MWAFFISKKIKIAIEYLGRKAMEGQEGNSAYGQVIGFWKLYRLVAQ